MASNLTDLKKQMQAPLIVRSDIPDDRRNEVVDIIVAGIDKHNSNLESAAKLIKETLDKQYGLTWQVIIGRGFCSDVTALGGNMVHLYYQGELGILAYKS
jgi:dynein light chain 4